MRKFNGRWHDQVSTESVQPGDYIEFYRQGYRVRKVRLVNLGHKHRFIRFEPMKVEAFKSYVVNLDEIQAVWRRCDGRRRPTGQNDGDDALCEGLSERPTSTVGRKSSTARPRHRVARSSQRAVEGR